LRSSKAREGWTGKSPLPGGDMDVSAVAALTAELVRKYSFSADGPCQPAGACLCTRAHKLLGSAKSMADLGQSFGATLTESEVRYLMSTNGRDRRRRRVAPIQARAAVSGGEIAALDEWMAAIASKVNVRSVKREDGHERYARPRHPDRGWDPDIRDVSLTLERGTLSVLLGPTLAGKTSIMRLLAGLDKPTTGRVLVDDKDVTGFDVRQRSVAMVYQQFINYPSFTVYENIASPLRVQGKPRAEIEKRVAEAARLLKLEPYLNRTPLQLSGGQQQRTAIARALVKGADLVLLDEPLANLDYKLREETAHRTAGIFEASGAIFVYATTEPSEALLLGGRTICMWKARPAGRRHLKGLSPPRDVARGAGVLRSPLKYRRHRKEKRQCAICRRHPGAGQRALRAARRWSLSRRFRAHQLEVANGIAGRHAFQATVTVTEITGSEKFRPSQPRRLQLGRGAAGRA